MITIIHDYNISDVKRELNRMLDEGSGLSEVRELALQATSRVPYNDNQIAAIYDFVKENIKYQPDPFSVELFIHPKKMIEFYKQGIAAGDCDDLALFTASMLRSIGYNARIVLLDTKGNGFDHAIAEVYSNKVGSWINLDTSSEKLPLGWEESYFSKVIV